jgi:hypothetical protein
MERPTDGQFGLARQRWGGRKENDMGGSSMCSVDGSPDSQAALGVAKKLAERLEAGSFFRTWPRSQSPRMAPPAVCGRAESRLSR